MSELDKDAFLDSVSSVLVGGLLRHLLGIKTGVVDVRVKFQVGF